MNPNHHIHIETPRLLIRALLTEDADGMFIMDSDPEVHRYVGKTPLTKLEQTKAVIEMVRQQYIDNGIGRWAMIEKTTNEFVGWTGFKLMKEKINGHQNFIDFGYRLSRKFWGKGYATEAGKSVMAYGLKHLNLKEIYGMTDLDNLASRRVLEKCGFQFIHVFPYDGDSTWREALQDTTWYQYQTEKEK